MQITNLSSGRSVTADVRNYYSHKIFAMGARSIMQHLYPRMLALHDLNDDIALPDPNGRVDLPSLMRPSHLFMESHGVYLIGRYPMSPRRNCAERSLTDNEDSMMLWIGSSVSPQLLKDLLDVDDILHINPHMVGVLGMITKKIVLIVNAFDSCLCLSFPVAFQHKSETFWHIDSDSEGTRQNLPLYGRTWTAPRSNSATCSSRTRTTPLCHTLIVRILYACPSDSLLTTNTNT